MKAKKNIAQQVMLYITLFGIIAVALVYFVVYKNLEDKAKSLKSSNSSLQVRVDTLKGYYDAMNDNQQAIDSMTSQINSMLDEFDADDIKEEDIIVQAIKTLDVSDIEYTNINIADRDALKTIDSSIVTAANIEGLDSDIIFVLRNAAYVSIVDYPNLKQCITELNKRPSRSTISNITFSTEDDMLEGTIEYNFYYVIGTPKEYVQLQLKDYTQGLEDLFKLKKPEEATDEAEKTEE